MIRYIAGRLLQALIVIFLVATVTFALLHAAPGDPISGRSESLHVSRDFIEQQRRYWGLDRPIHEQFLRYLSNLARGRLGTSMSSGQRPVAAMFREAIPNTIILAVAALLVDFALGIAAGVVQGIRPGSRRDRALTTISLVLYSIPVFWLGYMLLVVFGEKLHWFEVGGIHSAATRFSNTPIQSFFDLLWHLVLPALALGLIGAAGTARYQRAQLLETIRQDYIRTARAKGLPERLVVIRHALRNALLPTITLLGLSLPVLLSGAVLVESVFAWPGMGYLTLRAIENRDYFVVTGAAILASTMVVASNFVADILVRVADPRLRTSP